MTKERSYFTKGIQELTEIFNQDKDSIEKLEILAHELSFRKLWGARNLAQKVSSRLKKLRKLEGLQQPQLEVGTMGQLQKATLPRDIYRSNQRIVPDENGLLIPYLMPQYGERWITTNDLEQISTHFLRSSPNAEMQLGEVRKYHQQCLRQIKESRRYQIPSQGFAEVAASRYLHKLLHLKKLRFVQEGVDPPGVYLCFCFSSYSCIGVVKIGPDLSIEGFYEHQNVTFQCVIEMIAVAYYRDLVVPYEHLELIPHIHKHIQPTSNPKPISSPPRSLPREHTLSAPHINFQINYDYDIEDWHMKQEREAHRVVGHMRWIGSEFQAEDEKHAQAIEAIGKRLPSGYTWVVEHSRGHSQVGLSDLTEQVTFAPPRNATEEIENLLAQY